MSSTLSEREERYFEWALRLVMYVGIPIASFFAISGGFQFAIERFDKRMWRSVDAVITDVDIRSAGYRTYSTAFRYRFEAHGREWTGDSTSLDPNTVGRWGRFWFELNHSKGDYITVHYDPRDPQLHTIDRPSYWDASVRLVVGIGLALIPIANFLYAIGVGREDHGESAAEESSPD